MKNVDLDKLTVDIRVVNQLLIAQNTLSVFISDEKLGQFICQTVKNIPGIENAGLCFTENRLFDFLHFNKINCKDTKCWHHGDEAHTICSQDHDIIKIQIMTSEFDFGHVCLIINQPELFNLYEPFLRYFVNALSMMLENKIQKRQLEQNNMALEDYRNRLEELVEERTCELNEEIEKRKNVEFELINYTNKLIENNNELSISHQQLVQMIATKDRFFSIISHDLRSPFTSLFSFTELLRECINSNDREGLDHVMHEYDVTIEKIFNLLKNLLMWANLQRNEMKFNPVIIDMQYMIGQIQGIYSQNFKDKNIRFTSKLTHEAIIFGDDNMIETIFRNLINNAIKFTPKNGEICVDYMNSGINYLEFIISDTGIGIKRENIDKLFKLDQKFRQKGTNGEQGSGIGLILCKELVERNSGSIWVESELSKGSKFHVKLPLTPA